MEVDAIVLPTNTKLEEGTGASAAIFNKAGRGQLKAALKRHGDIKVGNAVPTLGFSLPPKYIVHTVVPRWIDGKHDEHLLLCAEYIPALRVADNTDCKSIAFPLLASGNNGFDAEFALEMAVKSIETYEPTNELSSAYLILYSMNATRLAQQRGYTVDKQIDRAYVLEHTEDQVPQTKFNEVLKEGAKFGERLGDEAFDRVIKRLSDPATVGFALDKATEAFGAITGEAAKAAANATPWKK